MKRFFAVIMISAILLTLHAAAQTSEYELKKAPDNVVIDGVLSEDEWDGAAKISLTKENTGMWANFYDEESRLPLYAYFYYGEQGIYVGADIYDNDVDTENMHDCFEVAFNPGGLIPDGDKLEGLFFTFWLDGDEILMKRHNRFDGDEGGSFEDGAVCRYKTTGHGYTVEALIKWEWLTMKDRPVLKTSTGKYKTGVLNKFDFSAEGAFTYAIVCYLNGNGADKNQYRCVYRTVTDPALAGNFSTATYDIKFTFAKEEETVQTEAPAETEPKVTEKLTEAHSTAAETEAQPQKEKSAPVLPIVLMTAAVVIAVSAALIAALKNRKK